MSPDPAPKPEEKRWTIPICPEHGTFCERGPNLDLYCQAGSHRPDTVKWIEVVPAPTCPSCESDDPAKDCIPEGERFGRCSDNYHEAACHSDHPIGPSEGYLVRLQPPDSDPEGARIGTASSPPTDTGASEAVSERCPTCGCPDPKHLNHGRSSAQGPCPDPFHDPAPSPQVEPRRWTIPVCRCGIYNCPQHDPVGSWEPVEVLEAAPLEAQLSDLQLERDAWKFNAEQHAEAFERIRVMNGLDCPTASELSKAGLGPINANTGWDEGDGFSDNEVVTSRMVRLEIATKAIRELVARAEEAERQLGEARGRIAELEQRLTTEGLPPDLARALRDPSIIVAKDSRVFDLIAEWQKAPSNTASAEARSPTPETGEQAEADLAAERKRAAKLERREAEVERMRSALVGVDRERWDEAIDPLLRELQAAQKRHGELVEAEQRVAIARMEREWLLGAWAAMAGIDQAEAEAEFLKASEKWREEALREARSPTPETGE